MNKCNNANEPETLLKCKSCFRGFVSVLLHMYTVQTSEIKLFFQFHCSCEDSFTDNDQPHFILGCFRELGLVRDLEN